MLKILFSVLFLLGSAVSLAEFPKPPSEQSTAEAARKLQKFKNIMIDLRGSRGGKGDVAAGYLTALDMIQRLKYKGTITFITDDEGGPAGQILGKLTNKPPLKNGDTLMGGKILVREAGKMPAATAPADLYLSFANPTQNFSQEESFVVRNQNSNLQSNASTTGGVPIDEKTVLISQTVLGNTENSNFENPLATVRRGTLSRAIPTAGLAQNEVGVYNDTAAANLRGRSSDEVRQFLSSEIGHIKDKSVAKNLSGLVNSKDALTGSQIVMAYGTTRTPEVKAQFESYLKGLVDEAAKKGTSFTVVMASNFDLNDIESPELREKIKLFSMDGLLPGKAQAGKIQVVTTKAVPHRVFVGLMALSAKPPVVAGDGALSAAVTLGKPFVMTRVEWNAKNVENYGKQIAADPNLTSEQRKTLMTIFPKPEEEIKLNKAANFNKEIEKAYSSSSERIGKLTDNIVATAEEAHKWSGVNVAKGVLSDPRAEFLFAMSKARENPSVENLSSVFSSAIKFISSQDPYSEATWTTSEEIESLVKSAQKDGKLNSTQMRNLEKAVAQDIAKAKNAELAINLCIKLGMNSSKEMISTLIKKMNSPKQEVEFLTKSAAAEALANENALKTIIDDEVLSRDFKLAAKNTFPYIGVNVQAEFVGTLTKLMDHDPRFISLTIDQVASLHASDAFRQEFEILYKKLSPEQGDDLIASLLTKLNSEWRSPAQWHQQIKKLRGERPLSPKLISAYADYLTKLKPSDLEEALKGDFIKGAGVEKAYAKALQSIPAEHKSAVANKARGADRVTANPSERQRLETTFSTQKTGGMTRAVRASDASEVSKDAADRKHANASSNEMKRASTTNKAKINASCILQGLNSLEP